MATFPGLARSENADFRSPDRRPGPCGRPGANGDGRGCYALGCCKSRCDLPEPVEAAFGFPFRPTPPFPYQKMGVREQETDNGG